MLKWNLSLPSDFLIGKFRNLNPECYIYHKQHWDSVTILVICLIIASAFASGNNLAFIKFN